MQWQAVHRRLIPTAVAVLSAVGVGAVAGPSPAQAYASCFPSSNTYSDYLGVTRQLSWCSMGYPTTPVFESPDSTRTVGGGQGVNSPYVEVACQQRGRANESYFDLLNNVWLLVPDFQHDSGWIPATALVEGGYRMVDNVRPC